MRPALLGVLLASALLAPAAHASHCGENDSDLYGPCRAGEQIGSWAGTSAGLTTHGIDGYAGSWVDGALDLQYDLAGDVPFVDAPWVGTHNSYNSVAEMGPTVSDIDSNQLLTMADQLEIDVRSLEIDVHWFPSLETAGRAPVVCHARGANQGHAGCTVEKRLDEVLPPIAAWLERNPGQVLLLYIEDHLEGEEGHTKAAQALRDAFGTKLHEPEPGGCRKLPLDLTRDEIASDGGQVVLVAKGCGAGTAWQSAVFDWSGVEDEARPRGFRDFGDTPEACGPNFTRSQYDSLIVRYYEDSTALTANAATVGAQTRDDGITPETAARMARCGVDLTGMDQLLPGDGRLEALVWSWDEDEPRAGGGSCSVQQHGRWRVHQCSGKRPAACRYLGGAWTVTPSPVTADGAAAACAALGAEHSVPRTGYENSLLARAAGAQPIWLAQRRSGDGWAALDARG